MSGKLVVIEGLDGSGKSTQLEILRKRLESEGLESIRIKLPDYESQSSALVKMYLSGELGKDPSQVSAYAASSFYAVDRYVHYNTKWRGQYENGALIIADRYTPSNAYHQAQKLKKDERAEYFEWLEEYEYKKLGIPKPDLVIFLDMPVQMSQKLMSVRYNGDESKKDIHEVNIEYLESCRETGLQAAEYFGWKLIGCSENEELLPIEAISEKIYGIVKAEIF